MSDLVPVLIALLVPLLLLEAMWLLVRYLSID